MITVAGLCGPLTTGGLSSRLALFVRGEDLAQRRAQGWDSMTYGIANTVGPTVVAAVAVVATPLLAVSALATAAIVSSVVVLRLPACDVQTSIGRQALPVVAAVKTILRVGALRRVMVATTLTAVSTGGVMVVAVVLGGHLGGQGVDGVLLGTSYGVGNVIGSLIAGVRPLRGEPERLAVAFVAANGVAVAACALVPDYALAVATFALAGATSALLFVASLAVRSTYSPKGARASVFVIMAGVKMAGASAGAALAGALVGINPRLALSVGALVTAFAVILAVADRRVFSRPSIGESVRNAEVNLRP